MHSLFTETRVRTTCEKLKTARQINVISISRTRIIHSFFRPKTAAVNKFRLLSFWKISFDRKNSSSGASADRRIFQKTKNGSLPRSPTPKNLLRAIHQRGSNGTFVETQTKNSPTPSGQHHRL
jgi:hypothetical protein